MINYKICFSDNEGKVNIAFETEVSNFLIAERKISKRLRKNGCILLSCVAWFE